MLYEVITRFATADYTGPIIEFDEGGNLIATLGNPGEAFYGFALSPTDSDKMWGNSQSPPLVCNGNRITSYNVCYTKLLRLALPRLVKGRESVTPTARTPGSEWMRSTDRSINPRTAAVSP